jgi:drug/metabolite transporter (DMT)-like permease
VVWFSKVEDSEPWGRRKLLGVIVGFGGVACLLGAEGGLLNGGGVGQLAVLGAAICYALGAVYGKRFGARPAVVNAASMLTCSTALLAPFAFVVEQPFATQSPDVGSWCAVVALALLSTAVAYLLYFGILKSAGATRLALVTYLIPVVSIGLGVVVLGDSLGIRELASMGMVFIGLALTDPSVFRGLGGWWSLRKRSAAAEAVEISQKARNSRN